MYLIYQRDHGFTSLMIACEEGHYEIVQLLLDIGANICDKEEVSIHNVIYILYDIKSI